MEDVCCSCCDQIPSQVHSELDYVYIVFDIGQIWLYDFDSFNEECMSNDENRHKDEEWFKKEYKHIIDAIPKENKYEVLYGMVAW